MSYLTQMLGLTVQNFVSAATGMAVLVALIRGIRAAYGARRIGNFWVDLTRTSLYILLPLSIGRRPDTCLARRRADVRPIPDSFACCSPRPMRTATAVTQQVLPLGPAASQIAIKQLGTNGGGFFNVNSAHPFENATPLSNFFEMLSILVISGALCYTFGKMVGDTRQGWALLTR